MQMKSLLRSAIVFGLLGSASAQAVMTQPDNGTIGGGSLFVTVFDTTNNESFTTDLGLLYGAFINNTALNVNTIRPEAFKELSYNLNMSVFADNNPANLLFNVYAGDARGGNGSKGQIITANATPTSNNGQMNGVNTAAAGLTTVFNQNCPGTATGCAGNFGATNLWGSFINGQFTVGSGAAFDTPIAFYLVAGANTLSGTALTTPTQFADANGAWTWLLAADGTLTFSGQTPAPIPLPAAVWLLLSGLAGIGAIGRRSNQKA
jgi:hypothetical protein